MFHRLCLLLSFSGRTAESHQSGGFHSCWLLNVFDILQVGNEKAELARCVCVRSDAATRRSAESRGPGKQLKSDHESGSMKRRSSTTGTYGQPSSPRRKPLKHGCLCTMTSHQRNLQHVSDELKDQDEK